MMSLFFLALDFFISYMASGRTINSWS